MPTNVRLVDALGPAIAALPVGTDEAILLGLDGADAKQILGDTFATQDEVDALVISGGGISVASEAEARAGTDNTKAMTPLRATQARGYYIANASVYGDGSTNATTHLQGLLDSARIAGGGTVVVPRGTYIVTWVVHPADPAYASCLRIGSKTRFVLDAGATIKLANSTAAVGGASGHALVYNYDIGGTTGDRDISIEGGTFDGNCGNNTVLTLGIALLRTVDCQHDNVTVKNCHGNAASGSGETFHFEAQLGARTVYRNCRVIADAGSTASGFSANGSTAVRYDNCLATGLSVAAGFTHYACSGVWHSQCVAFDNVGGFNSELSTNVSYVHCVAGIESAANANSEPYGNAEDLGNSGSGFTCAYQSQASYIGCVARENGGNGLNVADDGSDGSPVRVVGGEFSDNTFVGIYLGTVSCTESTVTGHPKVTGNGDAAYSLGAAGYQSESGNITVPPSIPATGVDLVNPFPFTMTVEVTPPANGNIYSVELGGVNTGRTGGTFTLAPGATIAINYGDAPTWSWWLGSAPVASAERAGGVTWNPASIASGAQTSTTLTVFGAAVGDPVAVGFTPAVPAGVLLVGAVTAADTVTATLLNMSGGVVDLGSGTLHARAWEHP